VRHGDEVSEQAIGISTITGEGLAEAAHSSRRRAGRNKLPSVRLSELVETLAEEIPADLWKKSFEWILART
jgi:hypothetical protein